MNIVIIGATSGIGKALFKKYASGDNRICIVGRRANLLEELSRKYSSKTISAKADITNLEEIDRAINALYKEMEHIDLAIVCSGTGDINHGKRNVMFSKTKRVFFLKKRNAV